MLGEAVIAEPAPQPHTAEETSPPITLVRAIQAYLEDHRSPNGRNSALNINTIKKYSETLGQLRRFSEAKGYTRVDHTRPSGVSDHVAGLASIGCEEAGTHQVFFRLLPPERLDPEKPGRPSKAAQRGATDQTQEPLYR